MTVHPRYPRGITKHAAGWRISLRVQGRLFQKRFKPTTSQADVEAALTKARARWTAGRLDAKLGSFAHDLARYLADYFAGRPGYAERARHLQLWASELGADVDRSAVTRDDVARILNGWRARGLAADTCNKRRTALLALYHALDGKGGSNPVREIPKFRPPDPLPRGVPYPQIEATLALLPACRTHARLRVMAYTGVRPSQLMRLKADDWDHRRRLLMVPGTEKGRGTKAYTLPLSRQAQAALTEFDELNAWGRRFTWAPMARMWREAWLAMRTGDDRLEVRAHPDRYRHIETPVPYDLRHSFGTQLYRKTGDLKAVKELLGHSSLKMTERYTLAAVSEQKHKAMKAFEASVGRKLPAAVATRATRRPKP